MGSGVNNEAPDDNTCTFADPIFPMAEIIRQAGGAPDAHEYRRSNQRDRDGFELNIAAGDAKRMGPGISLRLR